jgi:FkbM family methyltransferase
MSAKTEKSKVVIFGVGQIFQSIKPFLYETYDVIAFADNDPEKQGSRLDSIEIIHPNSILSKIFDYVIVTTPTFQKDVVRQLLDCGVKSPDILLAVNCLMQNDQNPDALYEYYINGERNISLRYSLSACANVLVENNDFSWILQAGDAAMLPSIINSGGFSNVELAAFFSLSKETFGETKGVFLDIGANIGTTSLAATKNSRVSEVIAVESSGDNFARLQCNIYINKLHNKIHAVNVAVSDSIGSANVVISDVAPGDNRVRTDAQCPQNATTEKIETLTIDHLLSDRDAAEFAFMWVDVQGYEYFVLNGAKNLIAGNKKMAVQIEFWPLGLRETQSLDLLCRFCKEHFSQYIDLREYLGGRKIIHKSNEIDQLPLSLKNHAYTDLFLIP